MICPVYIIYSKPIPLSIYTSTIFKIKKAQEHSLLLFEQTLSVFDFQPKTTVTKLTTSTALIGPPYLEGLALPQFLSKDNYNCNKV